VPTYNSLRERKLSGLVSDLVQFDADSIRQIARAQRRREPDVWVIDPDRYEQNGRILRDSDSARMVGYSKTDRILYATDGCNSCARLMPEILPALSAAELRSFADKNGVPIELLEYLVSLL